MDYKQLESTFQRDLNRIQDADRLTRKKGLQKLFEELPWTTTKKDKKKDLKNYTTMVLLPMLFKSLNDPVEKCRETSLKLIKKIISLWGKDEEINPSLLQEIIYNLTSRLNSLPYNETSEELRLSILEVIQEIIRKGLDLFLKKELFFNNLVSPPPPPIPIIDSTIPPSIISTEVLSSVREGKDEIGKEEEAENAMESNVYDIDEVKNALLKYKESLKNVIKKTSETLIKTLVDSFSDIKRISSEIITIILEKKYFHFTSLIIRPYILTLLKPLITNSSHQHNKTRSLSIVSIGRLLCAATEDMYTKILSEENLLFIVTKCVYDNNNNVKKNLAKVLSRIVSSRINILNQKKSYHINQPYNFISYDYEFFTLFLLLCTDPSEEVSSFSLDCLKESLREWRKPLLKNKNPDEMDEEIVDAEVALRDIHGIEEAEQGEETVAIEINNNENKLSFLSNDNLDDMERIELFYSYYVHQILDIVLKGMESWTKENKTRYILSTKLLITLLKDNISNIFIIMVPILMDLIRDDENEIRLLIEQVCFLIGSITKEKDSILSIYETISLRILGDYPGSDTTSQKTSAIRLATHVLNGFLNNVISNHYDDENFISISNLLLLKISRCVINYSVLNNRDILVRESLVLLARMLIDNYQKFPHLTVESNICILLLFLCGKCNNETDSISETASKLAFKFSLYGNVDVNIIEKINNNEINSEERLRIELAARQTHFSKHFLSSFQHIIFPSISPALSSDIKIDTENGVSNVRRGLTVSEMNDLLTKHAKEISWNGYSCQKAAIEILIYFCPLQAWKYYSLVFKVIIPLVQPPQQPAPNSLEANLKDYAAQRGDDSILPNFGDVDIRISLLMLLEGMLREGSSSLWEAGPYIEESAPILLKEILLPNLVWRVGRVESVVRKVSLASLYSLLKAGSVKFETLFHIAVEIVPILITNLDDNENTLRLLSILNLTVLFERLKGIFSAQSIYEMYPKIISRLDDSHDEVRIASCVMLNKFLLCGVNQNCYQGTIIDYILDQLFIHLDDTNVEVQEAVLSSILTAATINKKLVITKCELNRLSHRTTVYCDRILQKLQETDN